MGYTDKNGNWIEEFRSVAYRTEKEAYNKIKAVCDFYVTESGWVLNGEPRVENHGGEFVAVIPLKKPAELENRRQR